MGFYTLPSINLAGVSRNKEFYFNGFERYNISLGCDLWMSIHFAYFLLSGPVACRRDSDQDGNAMENVT